MSDLTADQTAAMFSVKPASVRRWATRTAEHEPCPHTKDGRGRLRFDPDAVAEWLDRTGVGRRSRAQTRNYPPPPPVAIFAAINWTPKNIIAPDLDADDRELLALHRTITTCLHVCRHSPDLPTPGELDLHTEEGREQAIDFLEQLDHRPAQDWKAIARHAIALVGNDVFMDAVYA